MFGYRKCPNLEDILVRAKLPKIRDKDPDAKPNAAPGGRNECKTKKCNYCSLMNKSGEIHSAYTDTRYSCKKNITCKSLNLIFCIQCKTCSKQYVGETSTTIMKRFQGHFDRIQRKVLNDDIGRHFNQDYHHGKDDLEIYVLDFVYCDPKVKYAKSLRLLIENNWIHKLRSQLPFGLNTMQSVKAYGTSRNWQLYKKRPLM